MDIYYIHVSRNITSLRKVKRLKQRIWRQNTLATHGDTLARTYKNCGLKFTLGWLYISDQKILVKCSLKKAIFRFLHISYRLTVEDFKNRNIAMY